MKELYKTEFQNKQTLYCFRSGNIVFLKEAVSLKETKKYILCFLYIFLVTSGVVFLTPLQVVIENHRDKWSNT